MGETKIEEDSSEGSGEREERLPIALFKVVSKVKANPEESILSLSVDGFLLFFFSSFLLFFFSSFLLFFFS